MKEVYELRVYQLAETLSDRIWHAFDRWPIKVQRTIGYQIIDAADSIAANIAEGYGRHSSPDRKRFYFYARGSFEETKAWLRKAVRRKIVSDPELHEFKVLVDELSPKLNAFIRST
ncbi:MAG: four helix bundle protein [Planctomycetota bacterium]